MVRLAFVTEFGGLLLGFIDANFCKCKPFCIIFRGLQHLYILNRFKLNVRIIFRQSVSNFSETLSILITSNMLASSFFTNVIQLLTKFWTEFDPLDKLDMFVYTI